MSPARPTAPLLRPLLYLALLTPLVVAPVLYPYVVPRALFFRLIVQLGLLALVFQVLRRRAGVGAGDAVLAALGVNLALQVLSSAVGVSPLRSVFGDFERMWGVFTWFHFAVFYVLLRVAFDRGGWHRFAGAAAAVGTLAALVGLVEAGVAAWRGVEGWRIISTVGNPGFVASYLIFTLAFTAALWSRHQPRPIRAALAAAALIQLLALLQTRGRAMILALAVAALWIAVRRFRAATPRRRVYAAAALAAVLAVGVGVAAAPGLPVWRHVPGLDRLAGGIGDPARFGPWADAMSAFQRRPLLGYGMENTYQAHSTVFSPELYDQPAMREVLFDRFHNAYLEALIGGGVLGGVAFLVFWAAILRALHLARRTGRMTEGEFLALSSAVVAYLAYLAFWFEDWATFPVVIVLAAWAGSRAAGAPLLTWSGGGQRSRGSTAVLGSLATVTVGLVVLQHGWMPLLAARRAATALRAEAPVERLHGLAAAARIGAAGSTPVLFRLVEELGTLEDRLSRGGQDPALGAAVDRALEAGLGAADREISVDPRNDLLYSQRAYLLGSALVHTRRPELYQAAVEDAARAVTLAPTRIPHREQLARLHLRVGRPGAAIEVLREALRVHDRLGSTHFLLARAHLASGDTVEAARSAATALRTPHPARESALVLRIGEWLEARGRPADAARLYGEYLDAWRGSFPAGREPGLRDPGDARVAARMPVALLRAGDRSGARTAAVALREALPGAAPEVEAFLRDLRAGRDAAWTARGAISVRIPAP